MRGKKLLYMRRVRRGDVFFVQLYNKEKHVQDGKRPCLVIQNNKGNKFSPTIIVVPLTSKIKKTYLPVHVVLEYGAMALCECVLTISKNQIINYVKSFDEKTMKRIDDALSISMGFRRRKKYKKDKAVL